ncbi:hypothetical protein AVEN_170067-1 [Araneus ventricosus]|uniref:Uncharacterized protein n=1 Tax=Araneus ventricosus TaxID=182803 RepID=A0A4Y2LJ72_ARAVE|nr:hypothetical protein AVEN_170067-1 [Araneus ventricosus]
MIEKVLLLLLVIKLFSCMPDFAAHFEVPAGAYRLLRPTLFTSLPVERGKETLDAPGNMESKHYCVYATFKVKYDEGVKNNSMALAPFILAKATDKDWRRKKPYFVRAPLTFGMPLMLSYSFKA